MLEKDGGNLKIIGYTLPRRSQIFEKEEMRNVFLAQSMVDKKFEDGDREVLS